MKLPKAQLLTVPLVFPFTLFEKLKTVVLRKGKIPKPIVTGLNSYFVYLPEISVGLALDVKSENLNRKLFNYFVNYSGLRYARDSENISLMKMIPHHYNQNEHRIVSYGVLDFVNIPRKEYIRFFNVLYEDMAMSPSHIVGDRIDHPTRWARFEINVPGMHLEYKFVMNSGIVYIDDINEELQYEPLTRRELYRFKATFVSPMPTGKVWVNEVNLYTKNEPEKVIGDMIPGYLNAVILSFTEINYKGRKRHNVNLLDESMVTPLETSDVLRQLVHYYTENVRAPIMRAKIPNQVVERILEKFSRYMGRRFTVETPAFSELGMRVTKTSRDVLVELLNPTYYYLLIKEIPKTVISLDDLYLTVEEVASNPSHHIEITQAIAKNSTVTHAKEVNVKWALKAHMPQKL
ncbi:hypothetical protein [Thermococcus barossii]|uniref:Uncharacterized protein n=1 Tax=Thermococcus barossii TaxID=54077 RepID=A0A2Z2MIZ4_9EURY|nr:hypothetical protein [Thermococcus barossii]ASJ05499.1 hypothetical protein A3L01_09035 [Thermococcus barossii]